MSPLPEIIAVVGLVFLRFGIPLLLMIGLGYFLSRLDKKWEAEALAEQVTREVRQEESIRHQPLSPTYRPEPALMDSYGKPCWDIKDCDPELREKCPAAQQPGTPCWLARRDAEGTIPSMCYHCELFTVAYSVQDRSEDISKELHH